jgi:hypothetical protein
VEQISKYSTPNIPKVEQFFLGPEYMNLDGHICDAVLESLVAVFDPDAHYREAALDWGIGAGKSFFSACALTYMIYRLLALPDPQAYYGLAPGSEIAVVNFSVTATQAKRVVFGEVLARMNNAPCFQQPGFARDEKINSELRWPEKSIILFPGNSQAESAIGYNVIGAVVDEASWLPDVEGTVRVAGRTEGSRYDAAEELYNAISKRISSRGNELWQQDAKLVFSSSPRYVGDFMERKMVEAQAHPDRIYGKRIATWEGAPKKRLSGETFHDDVCGEVPVEFKDAFDRNATRARRDLGALPSEAIDGYFMRSKVLAVVDHNRPEDGEWQLRPDWLKCLSVNYFVHVDLALRRDACGIALGHWDRTSGCVVADWVLRLQAADFGGEIDFETVRTILLGLKRDGFRLKLVTFDGWQSADSIQLLNKAGIRTELLSVDRGLVPYDTLLELINTGHCLLPDFEFLVEELCGLELIRGVKVDHPPRGSKDCSDALCGMVYNCYSQQRNSEGISMSVDGQEYGALYQTSKSVVEEVARPAGVKVVEEPPEGLRPLSEHEQALAQENELRRRIAVARQRGAGLY